MTDRQTWTERDTEIERNIETGRDSDRDRQTEIASPEDKNQSFGETGNSSKPSGPNRWRDGCTVILEGVTDCLREERSEDIMAGMLLL